MTENENNWSPPDPEAWKPPERRLEEDLSNTLQPHCINFILDANGEPIPEPDIMKWANWFEKGRKKVARTNIGRGYVSTVFLGLDHSFTGGDPILWETMIFGHNHFGLEFGQFRCSGSREQAVAMHRSAVREARLHIRFPKPFSRKRFIKTKRQARRRMNQIMELIKEDRIKQGREP